MIKLKKTLIISVLVPNTPYVYLPNEFIADRLYYNCFFSFRYAVIRDGKVDQVFESRFPEIFSDINSVTTKVDFGPLTDEQEFYVKK